MTTASPTVDTAALLAAEDARARSHRRESLAVRAYDALQELDDDLLKGPAACGLLGLSGVARSDVDNLLTALRRASKEL